MSSFRGHTWVAGTFVLATLLFLFQNARTEGMAEHARLTADLREMQRADAVLTQQVLQVRQGLLKHYDVLAVGMVR